MILLSRSAKHEFDSDWLPHITDLALGHLIALLERHDSRLLHEGFGDSDGAGCLEVHCMRFHPRRLEVEALYPMFTETDRGYYQVLARHWMNDIVGIDPQESVLLSEWTSRVQDRDREEGIEESLLVRAQRAASRRMSGARPSFPLEVNAEATGLATQTDIQPTAVAAARPVRTRKTPQPKGEE